MENLLTMLQQIPGWTLSALIIVPVLLGTAAFLFGKRDSVRIPLIGAAVVIVLLGGLLLVWQSVSGSESVNVLEIQMPSAFTNVGFILE